MPESPHTSFSPAISPKTCPCFLTDVGVSPALGKKGSRFEPDREPCGGIFLNLCWEIFRVTGAPSGEGGRALRDFWSAASHLDQFVHFTYGLAFAKDIAKPSHYWVVGYDGLLIGEL
jgi:hypothetical protein